MATKLELINQLTTDLTIHQRRGNKHVRITCFKMAPTPTIVTSIEFHIRPYGSSRYHHATFKFNGSLSDRLIKLLDIELTDSIKVESIPRTTGRIKK